MCARIVLTLLAPDSVVSHLEPAGGITAHVSSILAGPLLLFPQMLDGPGAALACPAYLTAHPLELLPGSAGSGQFPGYLSGTTRTIENPQNRGFPSSMKVYRNSR
jgi:hypothetical protein